MGCVSQKFTSDLHQVKEDIEGARKAMSDDITSMTTNACISCMVIVIVIDK